MVGGGEKSRKFACNALVLDVCRINEINIKALNVSVYIYKIEDLNFVAGDCSKGIFHLKRSASTLLILNN